MSNTMGRLLPSSDDRQVDYSPLLGFSVPAVREDSHTHVVTPASTPNLQEAVEIIRNRGADKPKAAE